MYFFVDLHVHSKHSRATSRDLDLEHLSIWARRKGIHVVGTGDFTHPTWRAELQSKLVPAEDGLFRLTPEIEATLFEKDPTLQDVPPTRFFLTAEVNNIFRTQDGLHKIQSILTVPSFEIASQLCEQLAQHGDLFADGRPTLDLSGQQLLEYVISHPQSYLIPSHIWSPWFSLFSPRGGVDNIQDCFGDLSTHIFALDSGISADPLMSRRLSSLDAYTLVAASDAHSPSRLGRKVNRFETTLSYKAIFDAIKEGPGHHFLGTYETHPAAAKYYYDGHRACRECYEPQETLHRKYICAACKKPVTLGVLHQVEQRADRTLTQAEQLAPPFRYILPLEDLLAELLELSPKAKKVQRHYFQLIYRYGPELPLLMERSLDDIDYNELPLFREALARLRQGDIHITPGFDGRPGLIEIFHQDETKQAQQTLFPHSAIPHTARQMTLFDFLAPPAPAPAPHIPQLDLFTPPTPPPQTSLPLPPPEETTPTPSEKPSPVPPSPSSPIPEPPQTEEESWTPSTDSKPLFPSQRNARQIRKAFAKYVLPPAKQLLSPLNIEQRAPVKHWGSPMLIASGPGTGKTYTLTTRIAYLTASRRLHPTHILAFTSTNKSARQMAERLDELVGLYRGVTIGTFHRFCLNLLQDEEYAYRLIGEAERMILMRELSQHQLSSTQQRQYLDKISKYKQKSLLPDQLEDEDDEQFVKLYQAYERTLHQEELYDLEDLLLQSIQLLEQDPSLCHQLQLRFRSIHVDDYQDINEAQYRLLRLLVSPENDLCVAGDADQSIFGFRGGAPTYLRHFEQDFSFAGRPARRFTLWRNYRSPECVIDISQQVIASQSNQHRIIQTSIFSGLSNITYLHTEDEHTEARYIAEQIQQLISPSTEDEVSTETSYTLADIAILYSSNQQLPPIQKELKRQGIPYRIAQPISIPEKLPELRLFLALLRYFSPPHGDWLALYEIFCTWPHLSEMTFPQIQALRSQHPHLTPDDCLAHAPEWFALGPKLSQEAKKLRELIRSMRASIQTASAKEFLEQHLSQMEDMLDERWVPGKETRILLYERAAATPFFSDFLQHLLLEEDPDPYIQPAARLSLRSLTAAKGTEYPVVFLPGCEESFIPPSDSPEEEAEHRRLFYVGMTRTKSKLYLSHVKHRQLDGERQSRSPSRYIQEVYDLLDTPDEAEENRQQDIFSIIRTEEP